MSNHRNKRRVLEAIKEGQKSQAQLAEHLNLGIATICRWVNVLLEEKAIHVYTTKYNANGGPAYAIYAPGPTHIGRKPKPARPQTQAERSASYRKRLRAAGEWEHRLAKNRARHRADNPKRDPITAALFP